MQFTDNSSNILDEASKIMAVHSLHCSLIQLYYRIWPHFSGTETKDRKMSEVS